MNEDTSKDGSQHYGKTYYAVGQLKGGALVGLYDTVEGVEHLVERKWPYIVELKVQSVKKAEPLYIEVPRPS